jgi:hypothetical protein
VLDYRRNTGRNPARSLRSCLITDATLVVTLRARCARA